ncbi:DNA polymerase III subunit beta [Candidatus Methylobacter favarea]|uniref:DNA polymerase III subunit beta n=1 Tax=Candidatus Methylobacter favarea TaxID=2707345 RepID=A0A8S0WM18_9GAMM|nr:nucleotidyltransferase domain-containing protein [Candidatus Methylobacter favarea]CAA9893010.1 DNA polymerase III subunit beta [Candidatus Methylobacter favarea]
MKIVPGHTLIAQDQTKTVPFIIDNQLREVLAGFPELILALVFGSVAQGRQRPDSDLDIAVAANQPLTAVEKMAIIAALAEQTGRPVDLIDLKVVAEPLLGQILRHGRRLLGSNGEYGRLISRHLFEQADFMPYRNRVLAERRTAWIGK